LINKRIDYFHSPLGLLKITVKHDKLISIKYYKENEKIKIENDNISIINEIKTQLREYFNKERREFNLSLKIEGTQFQKDVYKTLQKVGYGEVITYKNLAERSGHPKAYRAVGTALKNNKIPIIIPCHRVIKTDNSIGNYNGGVWRKEKLLQLEDSNFF
jgi:methylated-DNA-[protein]-cysteine S-methyltransferase